MSQLSDSTGALLSVLGTPSRFAYEGSALIRAMTDLWAGSHDFIRGVFWDDVKSAWRDLDRTRNHPVIFFSDCPDDGVIRFLRESNAPCVIFVDDFQTAAVELIESRGMTVFEALRFNTQVVCSLEGLRDHDVLIVTPDWLPKSLEGLTIRICQFLDRSDGPEIAGRLLHALGYTTSEHPSVEAHFYREEGSGRDKICGKSDRALISRLALGYAGMGVAGAPLEIRWPAELFLDWDHPGSFLNGPIGLLGPARFIICGPYLHLPEGPWEAHVIFEVSENISGNRLGVDVFSGKILRGVTANLPSEGVFAFTIAFSVENPFLPVELRFQILSGAIEGFLTLQRVSFRTPVKSAEPVLRQKRSAAER